MAENAGPRAARPPIHGHPTLGLEGLDLMGIDIDQDPRAFARFLELKKLTQRRIARPPLRKQRPRIVFS